jgi:hypothetical protein
MAGGASRPPDGHVSGTAVNFSRPRMRRAGPDALSHLVDGEVPARILAQAGYEGLYPSDGAVPTPIRDPTPSPDGHVTAGTVPGPLHASVAAARGLRSPLPPRRHPRRGRTRFLERRVVIFGVGRQGKGRRARRRPVLPSASDRVTVGGAGVGGNHVGAAPDLEGITAAERRRGRHFHPSPLRGAPSEGLARRGNPLVADCPDARPATRLVCASNRCTQQNCPTQFGGYIRRENENLLIFGLMGFNQL